MILPLTVEIRVGAVVVTLVQSDYESRPEFENRVLEVIGRYWNKRHKDDK